MPKTIEIIAEPPEHLSETMKTWWRSVLEEFDLELSQIRTLQLASEAYDRAQWARESTEASGLVYVDRFGQPKPRPECGIARDNSALFARLVRELNLDIEAPETRLPRSPGRNR